MTQKGPELKSSILGRLTSTLRLTRGNRSRGVHFWPYIFSRITFSIRIGCIQRVFEANFDPNCRKTREIKRFDEFFSWIFIFTIYDIFFTLGTLNTLHYNQRVHYIRNTCMFQTQINARMAWIQKSLRKECISM